MHFNETLGKAYALAPALVKHIKRKIWRGGDGDAERWNVGRMRCSEKKNKVRWASASEVSGEEREEGGEQLRQVEMSCWTVKLSLPAVWKKMPIMIEIKASFCTMSTNSHLLIHGSPTNARYTVWNHIAFKVQLISTPKTGGSSAHLYQRGKMKSEIERISQFYNFLYSANGLLTSFYLK